MKTAAPLGIIAAAGELPRLAATAAVAQGRPVFIIVLKDIATADFSAFPSTTLRVGGFKAIVKAIHDAGCSEVLLSGKFIRPRLADIVPDSMASGVAMTLMTSGDDAALRKIRAILAENGISIADTADYFSTMKAPLGVLTGQKPDAGITDQINRGVAVLASLGDFDIGQAVIVQGSRVLAIEAAEGTDAMIARAAGLIDRDLGPSVMVKMMKSGQDRSLDPPVIGSRTVADAGRAGIGVIAIEADGVIIHDKDETLRQAEAAGLTLIGVAG